MGLAIGVILSFIGMGLLLGPFIIDISKSKKETNKDYKRELEASAWIIGIATLFLIGGILIVAFTSGSKLVSAGLEGYTGKKQESNVMALLQIKKERQERQGRPERPEMFSRPVEPFRRPERPGELRTSAEPYGEPIEPFRPAYRE